MFLPVFLIITGMAFGQTVNPLHIDGRVYFKFKNTRNVVIPSNNGTIDYRNVPMIAAIAGKYQVKQLASTFYSTSDIGLQNTYRLDFNDFSKINDLIAELQSNPEIEYAEAAPLFQLHFTPNDPNYSTTANRWHLDKISATGAWDVSHGSASVVVAVIDNGIWTAHPDLAGKVVGQVDLADGDNDPTPPSQTAEWSHGTHTSGLACAATNNGVGTASIGFDISLLAIKVGADADMAMTAGFEGITYAADHGANVISMSWGSPAYFATMQNVIDYAYNNGCVLLASAGNNGDGMSDPNNPNSIMYPAACNHVISVGATNGNDKMASFSQYGTWVDLCAPGGYQNDGGWMDIIFNYAVYSLAYGTGTAAYTKMVGTSMSCPIAAGLAGLMISKDPNLTPDKVEAYMKATCTNINALQDAAHNGMNGAGRINASAALNMVQDSISTLYANFSASNTFISEGATVNFFDETLGNPTSWTWTFEGATPTTSHSPNPVNILYENSGVYRVTLSTTDGTNYSSETKQAYINVQSSGSSAWIQQVAGLATPYRGIDNIYIVDEDIVWGTAINGMAATAADYYTLEFIKTNNGGNTWVPGSVTGVPSTYVISSICATSYTKAWISCFNNDTQSADKGGIYVTTDGGTTWTRQSTAVFNDAAAFPNVVYFWDDNTGWCMGDPVGGYYEMYTTTDGGATWTRTPTGNIPAPISGEYGYTSLYEVIGDMVLFGTNNGRIFKSVDKGLNWTVSTVSGVTDIQKLTFNDAQNGLLQQITYNATSGALETFTMKRTIDGGTTWQTLDTAGLYKTDIDGVPGIPGMYVAVGASSERSGSAYTIDHGDNWITIDEDIQYIGVKFLNDEVGYAGGFSLNAQTGGIYKWDGLTSIDCQAGPYCPGDALDIYLTLSRNQDTANVFTVELSDENGDFDSPVTIGTKNGFTSDTISVTLPSNALAGSDYRIRIVMSSPADTTADNGRDITILGTPSSNAGLDAEVCYLSSYTLNGTAADYTSVAWTTSGTGTFDDAADLNAVYTPSIADSTAGTVYLILEASSTCGASADSLELDLTTNATADAGLDKDVCDGASTQLIANGGSTYAWVNDGTVSDTSLFNPVVSPLATTTYYVYVSSGCGSALDSVVVTVLPLPAAAIAALGDTSFCTGNSVDLQVTTTGAGFSYQWYIDGYDLNAETNVVYEAAESGLFSAEVTDDHGCTSLSNEIEVVVSEVPDVTLSITGEQEFCEGDSALLSTPDDPNYSFVWLVDGNTIPGATSNSIYVSETGDYSVTVTENTNLCYANSNSIGVTVNPNPATPTITWNGTVLISSGLSGNQWYLNGSVIPGATTKNWAPQVNGTYSVMVTNTTTGCVSGMSDTIHINTGIADIAPSEKISVFPNPTKGKVTFMIPAEGAQITIFDMLGNVVATKTATSGANEINLIAPEGMYIARIIMSDRTYTTRLILRK